MMDKVVAEQVERRKQGDMGNKVADDYMNGLGGAAPPAGSRWAADA